MKQKLGNHKMGVRRRFAAIETASRREETLHKPSPKAWQFDEAGPTKSFPAYSYADK